jgi:hypothetical protein
MALCPPTLPIAKPHPLKQLLTLQNLLARGKS